MEDLSVCTIELDDPRRKSSSWPMVSAFLALPTLKPCRGKIGR